LPQLKEICQTISVLEAKTEGSSSSNPAVLFSILYLLSTDPQMGRIQISRVLFSSEQIVRSAIRKLNEAGLLILKARKKEVKNSLGEAMKCLTVRRLFTTAGGWENPLIVGVSLHNGKKLTVRDALLIRDEIIYWGGSAAIVFLVKGKAVRIPGVRADELEKFLEEMKLKDGIYALVSTKYDYSDYPIFYGFVKKICELFSSFG